MLKFKIVLMYLIMIAATILDLSFLVAIPVFIPDQSTFYRAIFVGAIILSLNLTLSVILGLIYYDVIVPTRKRIMDAKISKMKGLYYA